MLHSLTRAFAMSVLPVPNHATNQMKEHCNCFNFTWRTMEEDSLWWSDVEFLKDLRVHDGKYDHFLQGIYYLRKATDV